MAFSLFGRRSEHISSNFKANEALYFFDQSMFKTGTTLEVKDNEFACATCEGVVLDVFPGGVYNVMLDRMPKLFNYLKTNSAREINSNLKRIPVEFYFVNASELTCENIATKNLRFNVRGSGEGGALIKNDKGRNETIKTKLLFTIKYNVVAPDVYMQYLLRNRKAIKNKQAEKVTLSLFANEISRAIKRQTLDITENDYGFGGLEKLALEKINLKKYGIEISELDFNEFKTSEKVLAKIQNLAQANKTLDVEFKKFTNAETEEVVLEKVGTEAFMDKTIPVDKIGGGTTTEDVALLNINTGDDAKREVVWNRNEEDANANVMSSDYTNKLDGMLINAANIMRGRGDDATQAADNSPAAPQSPPPQFVRHDVYCRQCGARLEPEDRFCGSCGTRVK